MATWIYCRHPGGTTRCPGMRTPTVRGTFGPQQVITTEVDNAASVYAADLDGDGDLDVLSASTDDNKIAWYENTDGFGSFGPQDVITRAAGQAWSVYAGDVDGDGDLDVLSASYGDGKVAWYENTDGLGSFLAQQVITQRSEPVRSARATWTGTVIWMQSRDPKRRSLGTRTFAASGRCQPGRPVRFDGLGASIPGR